MNDVFDLNISVLRKTFPELARQLLNEKKVSRNEYRVTQSSAGDATLTINGHYIHSQRDPVREGRRLAEAALQSSQGISGAVVFLGFGLGYAAQAAAELSGDSIFIIAENDIELFRLTLETRDITKIISNSKIIFMLGGEASGINAALTICKNIRSVIRNKALCELAKEWFSEIENHINTWKLKDTVNAATLSRFGKRWVRNIYANSNALCEYPGINLLAGKFDFPVLLLAGGPSLDNIAEHLAELKKRCLIISVDTALRFCLQSGVIPDFVVSCDGQYWNYRHLDRAVNLDSCLVTESSVHPSLLRDLSFGVKKFKRIFFSGSLYPAGRFIEDNIGGKGLLSAGGSVATSALDFAFLLQGAKNKVWIAGLDLGFIENKTHYKGALFEEQAANSSCRFIPAETVSFKVLHSAGSFYAPAADGGRILTDKRLSLYAAWFENTCKTKPDVFSLSQKGLFIKALKPAAINDILALSPIREKIDQTLGDTFLNINATWNNEQEVKKRKDTLEKTRCTLTTELKKIKSYTESGMNIAALTSPAKDTALFLLQNKNAFTSTDLAEAVDFNITLLESRHY